MLTILYIIITVIIIAKLLVRLATIQELLDNERFKTLKIQEKTLLRYKRRYAKIK